MFNGLTINYNKANIVTQRAHHCLSCEARFRPLCIQMIPNLDNDEQNKNDFSSNSEPKNQSRPLRILCRFLTHQKQQSVPRSDVCVCVFFFILLS